MSTECLTNPETKKKNQKKKTKEWGHVKEPWNQSEGASMTKATMLWVRKFPLALDYNLANKLIS